MSKEALEKLALIQGAVEGRYKVREVASRLGLTTRRVKQLKRAFREQGEQACIHGNSGRRPANCTDEKLRLKIISLKQSEIYQDTHFLHFKELLLKYESIEIGYTTLSGILKNAGITSKRTHRAEGKRYKRRERRSALGEMPQGDARQFDWLGSGERYALHGFIDDATGIITGLYFCKNECLMGYLEVMRQTLENHGIPQEIYVDKAGIFFVNTKKEANWTIDEKIADRALDKTQLGKIAEDHLGINLIRAHSPQAKGRIERLRTEGSRVLCKTVCFSG